jgi:aarF domain-containing kinase
MKIVRKITKYAALCYLGSLGTFYAYNQLPESSLLYNRLAPYLLPAEGLLVRTPWTLGTFAFVYAKYRTMEWYYEAREVPDFDAEMDVVNEQLARQLLRLCLGNGGIWIKWGQIMASMRGYLPDIYCDVLAETFNQVPPVEFATVRELFREEFGKDIEDLYSRFDEKPLASASLAQVHHALTKDGIEVAVKVQYPKVKYFYIMDFKSSEILRKVVDWVKKRVEREDLDKKVNSQLELELDFHNELRNTLRAKKDLDPLGYIYVPFPIPSLSTKRILTMEYIHGFKGNDVEGMNKAGYSSSDVATKLFNGIAEQIFTFGFVHGDPHSGNFLVRGTPGNTKSAQIVLIDHGLYDEFSNEFRLKYCEFWNALVLRDHGKIKEYCTSIGITNHSLYTEMILMQGLDSVGPVLQDFDNVGKGMTQADKDRWMKMEETNKDDLDNIRKFMPHEMIFLFRSAFLLRGVNQTFGAPVNRFTIFARIATKNIRVQDHTSWLGWLKSTQNSLVFEFSLRWLALQTWFITILFSIMGESYFMK